MQEKLSLDIVKYLQEEKKILTANTYSARGSTFVEFLDVRQMDVLTVVVDEQKADEVFEYIYYEAKIDRPHGGMIFQELLGRSTSYELPKT
ncbi:MAG: hypothetical protein OQK11_08110 [Thiovulaceae bacterium]|nr:hypothetical protein [Sulfurimonadaceae bacterium]